jgi:peptidoglycan/xylan/chitin deacetylase (PgdA/CDA1 family)
MYHRVAPIGEKTTQRWRITPDVFEEQLKYLLDAGYYSISWEEWQSARASQKPLPGRAIAITFDDGYLDFFEYAWPLLKKYGFSATVFLVADNIGKFNSWDKVYNEELPLMGWNEIRKLQEEGVNFGSHSTTHLPLTSLSVTEVVRDAARSRTILTKELQEPVRAFAYPYGDVDEVVQHIVGACGYTFGFSCRTGLTTFKDDLLELPRIEVTGSDTFQEFVAKLK